MCHWAKVPFVSGFSVVIEHLLFVQLCTKCYREHYPKSIYLGPTLNMVLQEAREARYRQMKQNTETHEIAQIGVSENNWGKLCGLCRWT